MLEASQYQAEIDPIAQGIKPDSVNVYTTYRHGDVYAIIFENNEYHICYGMDEHGSIWDACARYRPTVTNAERDKAYEFYQDGPTNDEYVERLKKSLHKMMNESL